MGITMVFWGGGGNTYIHVLTCQQANLHIDPLFVLHELVVETFTRL